MAIYYPDILEHNNSNYPLLDPTFLKGTAYPLASIDTTGSIPADKRNVGMIVFDSGSGKFYGYKGSNVSNWATASNWIEFGSGSGGGGATDITALNNFTGSMYVTSSQLVNTLDEPSPWVISGYRWDGTLQTSFLMDQTRDLFHNVTSSVKSLTAATSSYIYSGSYSGATSTLTLYSKNTDYILDLSGLAGGGGGGFAITASNEGTVLTENVRTFDFVGNAVTATNIGSAVTVTINTGSAPSTIYNSDGEVTGNRTVLATDKTLLFQISGSSQFLISDGPIVGTGQTWTVQIDNGGVYLDGLLPNTATPHVVGFDSTTGKLSYYSTASFGGGTSTDITALNNFTGSANTRLNNLEAATGSYYHSSSINSNVITFNQEDGTTESVTIVVVPSASYAPNIYNTDSALTGNRMVTVPSNTSLKFRASTSGATFQIESSATSDVNITNLPTGISSSLLAYNTTTGKVVSMDTSSIQNVISASYAPNLYNSNGTLIGTRAVNLSTYDLTFNNSSAKFIVSGSDRVVFNNLNNSNPGYVVTYDPTGTTGTQGIIGYVTASAFGGTTNTGSLLVTGSVSNATLTFTKGNGTTFPLTINNVANATTAGSVTSDSVYAEAGTDFDVWSAAGSTFTLLDVNSTNIQAVAPKSAEDSDRIFAVATMEVYRGTVSTNHTAFQCRLYNSTQAAAIPGSTRTFSSYLLGSGEGPIPTTFTFTVPISGDITSGDTIQLQVRESPAAVLGTYSSASISYADLALISITD